MKNTDWRIACWGLNNENERLIEFYKLGDDGHRFPERDFENIRFFLVSFGRTNAENEDQLRKEFYKNDDRFPILHMCLNDFELKHLLNNFSISKRGNLAIIDMEKVSQNFDNFKKYVSDPSRRRNDFRNKWGFNKFW